MGSLATVVAVASVGVHATQFDAVQFVDVAQEAGIDFRHESGRTGALRLPEIIGAGAAIFDYDGDGRMDVYLVQGGPLPGNESEAAHRPSDRLYRNVGRPGEIRFEDVSADVGLTAGDYGMGVATGDIDNDGDTDLFRTALGRNRLLINAGGRFVNGTDTADVAGDEWSVSASFADIDGNGLLDLYVANYLAYEMARSSAPAKLPTRPSGRTSATRTVAFGQRFLPQPKPSYHPIGLRRDGEVRQAPSAPLRARREFRGRETPTAQAPSAPLRARREFRGRETPTAQAPSVSCEIDGHPRYCPPSHYVAVPDRLYRNLGGGRFEDVSASWQIATQRVADHAAMGVASADFNMDGRTDFLVANDGTANRVWMNRGGRFEDIAFTAGAAVNADGAAEAGMGVVVADFDADGDSDVFLTHDVAETNTLYVNGLGGRAPQGASSLLPRFLDQSARLGVAAGSLPFTGFGTGAFDIENDGDLDLFIANGPIAEFQSGTLAPSSLANVLLVNDGNGQFQGKSFSAHRDTSRGAAFGDLDNDGDIDIVVANNDGPARVYRNDGPAGNWLGIAARGQQGQRNAIGATVWRLPSPQLRRIRTDGSYASASDPRLVFGLGEDDEPQFVRVRWPDGVEQTFGPLLTNRYHMLRPD